MSKDCLRIDSLINSYIKNLELALTSEGIHSIPTLAMALHTAWLNRSDVYICGNVGSAANAIHMANDFIYGAGLAVGLGLRVEALTANSAVLTCLANDVGYSEIFVEQLKVKGKSGDILIALSGSGNSENIVSAIKYGNSINMETFAVTGFTGGRCLLAAKYSIHFPVSDMQISEDMQLIVGHICMQWLSKELSKK